MPSPKQKPGIQIDTKSPEGTPKSNEKSSGSSSTAAAPTPPGSTTNAGRPATASVGSTAPKAKASPRKTTVQQVTLAQLSAMLTPRGQPIQTFPNTPTNAHGAKTPRYTATTVISSPLAGSPLTSPLMRSPKVTIDRATQLKNETETMQYFLSNTLDNIRDCSNRIEHVKSDVVKNAWEITQHDLSNFEKMKKVLESDMKRIVDLKKSDSHLLNAAGIITLEQNLNKRNTDINKIIPIIYELKLAVKSQIINIQKCGEILDKLGVELKQVIPPSTPTPTAGL
jgi:hypothetical protein